jgi:hypothetical protein
MAIAVIVATASLSYLPGINQTEGGHGLVRVDVQSSLELATDRSNQRLVDLTDPFSGIGPKVIFGALFSAFMLYLLDHNISSTLTESPKVQLEETICLSLGFLCSRLDHCSLRNPRPPSRIGFDPTGPSPCKSITSQKIRGREWRHD